jgi:hypothetical protein
MFKKKAKKAVKKAVEAVVSTEAVMPKKAVKAVVQSPLDVLAGYLEGRKLSVACSGKGKRPWVAYSAAGTQLSAATLGELVEAMR